MPAGSYIYFADNQPLIAIKKQKPFSRGITEGHTDKWKKRVASLQKKINWNSGNSRILIIKRIYHSHQKE